MPYKTGIRLLGVARNPANGFPARLLDHSPQNMATLRQIAHNLLKRETSPKVAIQGKGLQEGWRDDYPQIVLLS